MCWVRFYRWIFTLVYPYMVFIPPISSPDFFKSSEDRKRWRTIRKKESVPKDTKLTMECLKLPHRKRAIVPIHLLVFLFSSQILLFLDRKSRWVFFGTGCPLSITSNIITSFVHTCTTGKLSQLNNSTRERSNPQAAILILDHSVPDHRSLIADSRTQPTTTVHYHNQITASA